MRPFITIVLALTTGVFFQSAYTQIKNDRNIPFLWETDTTIRKINLSELTVVVPRFTFPPLDYPRFVGKDQGLSSFLRHEPVIAVSVNGEAKAYPLNMLTMHEISNDSLGGVPILPTYCPLCNSSVVYDRRVKRKGKTYVLDFEVSGMLRHSDMVMADRQTESWWQQMTGRGLVGAFAGAKLEVVPSMIVSVEHFFNKHPEGKILSRRTGTRAESSYGLNPYVKYDDENNKPYSEFFDLEKLDTRLPAMERIIHVEGSKSNKVYPFSMISREGVINDVHEGRYLVIFYQEGTLSVLDEKEIEKSKNIGAATVFSAEMEGRILTFKKVKDKFIDVHTKSVWDITGRCIEGKLEGKELMPEPHSNHFAFAWFAFYPDSQIYGR